MPRVNCMFRRENGRLLVKPTADELYQDIKKLYDKIGAVNRAEKLTIK